MHGPAVDGHPHVSLQGLLALPSPNDELGVGAGPPEEPVGEEAPLETVVLKRPQLAAVQKPCHAGDALLECRIPRALPWA